MEGTRLGDDATSAHSDESGAERIETPVHAGNGEMAFGSDAIAETLRALGIRHIALNPGSSYRGLHDSLVNHLGNEAPQMLVCLHEEAAVAIAHGWAKVTGEAMAAAVHSNVGLFHATMAVFNAWCDRMPVLLLGATGPVDAAKRRPWIDWIHTARDQGAIVRHYTKWDDQPASVTAACESVARAALVANTVPQGPTYVVLDAAMQEEALTAPLPPVDIARLTSPPQAGPSAAAVADAIAMLQQARRVVILAGRASRNIDAWQARVAIAEKLGASVLSDLKVGASFPTDHPLHVGAPAVLQPAPEALAAIGEADVVLSLDWVALAGTLDAAKRGAQTKIIDVSLDHYVHNGWSMDYQALAPADLRIASDPDAFALALADALPEQPRIATAIAKRRDIQVENRGRIEVAHIAAGLREAVDGRDVSLLHLPLSWDGGWWPFRHPLDFLGSDGGGGVGGGPGISVGAALALKDSGRLPVSICGDGDFLMGVTALWTAAHYGIPLLLIVANNRSFFNDEIHQERVAIARGRAVENRWIGQRMTDPDLDIASLARAQGALGIGPVETPDALDAALREAIAHVDAGGVAVVDARVEPGYTPAMANTVSEDR